MIMPYASKRPCCICHRWFRPNNRVGSRQRACGRPDCQRLRHQRNQAAWVARHPDYFAGRRIQDRIKLDPPQKALRLPSPLNQLPWDIAQDQFGAQGADFIGVMGALLVRLAQDQFASYSIDSNGDPYQGGGMEAQYQFESAAEWSGGGGQAGYASGISSTGASP